MNIYFVGYRGTGKTSLGRLLRLKLGRPFVDTDDLIVEREGKLIPAIFKEDGEAYFRQVESEVLKEIAERDDLIVATGGGIIISQANRDLLKSSGYVIYLQADSESIYRRIGGDSNRPALTDKSALDEIASVFAERKPWYEEVGRMRVDTVEHNPEECVELIINQLKQEGLL